MNDNNILPFRDPEPRSEVFTHRGIRSKITYDVTRRKWRWSFTYTVPLTHTGEADTLVDARKAIVKKIEAILP